MHIWLVNCTPDTIQQRQAELMIMILKSKFQQYSQSKNNNKGAQRGEIELSAGPSMWLHEIIIYKLITKKSSMIYRLDQHSIILQLVCVSLRRSSCISLLVFITLNNRESCLLLLSFLLIEVKRLFNHVF